MHAFAGDAPAVPLSIMTVLGGRVTTNVEMLPQALRLNRPTRAEASIAAEVIEQLYAQVCAARRAGFAMPQKPDEAALQEDYQALVDGWSENDHSYIECDVYVEGFGRGFDFALSHGRRDAQASPSSSTRTLLEKVYERLCKAQMFDIATEVRKNLEASAAATSLGLPPSQEPKYTVDGISVINRASGQRIPADEPVFIMRARDTFAAGAIYNYALDCPPGAHREAVLRRFDDFTSFAKQHPARMRAPDTAAAP